MAKFPGFQPPKANFSKLPHSLIEALPLVESLAELKVVLYVLRHTWGYQEYQLPKRITMDEFEHGRKAGNGARLDNGVGMAKNSVKAGISKAIEHGFLQRKAEKKKDFGRSSYVYSLVILRGQDLTPGGQELTVIGSEVDPRTEKETKKESLSTESIEQTFDTVDESNVIDWLAEKKKSQVKPVREQVTEEDYKERISQAIVESEQTVAKDGSDLKIENYLVKVPEQVRELARAFCYKFGRPPTKKEDKLWRSNWNDQIEIGLTPALVEAAFEIMEQTKPEPLTIRAPSSVNAVAERLKRKGAVVEGGETVKLGDIEYTLPKAARISGK
jgi:hypothetical protein